MVVEKVKEPRGRLLDEWLRIVTRFGEGNRP
jgi:hypothetical protein